MPAQFRVRIPEKFPRISAGTILDDGTLVSGHENGYVVHWQDGGSNPKVILRASSEVHAVVLGKSGNLFVGCNAGDLYRISDSEGAEVERILPPTNTKDTRVFRIQELRPGEILYSSTYGVVNVLRYRKHEQRPWAAQLLPGHTNAVFATAQSRDGIVATGDYRGVIRTWRLGPTGYVPLSQLAIPAYVSGLTFLGTGLLAALGQNGILYLFEKQAADAGWRPVFETDAASGLGRAISGTAEGRVVAATEREVIEIDPASQVLRAAKVGGGIAVFARPQGVLVLTRTGLLEIPWEEFSVRSDIVAYEYLKVSLLGNTGYGKTTLASMLSTGQPAEQQATFGRRVWPWRPTSSGADRRVLLNDNGGQEQVVGTLLPLSADSDVVLFFFKQTELAGLYRAMDLHERLQTLLNPRSKCYLVETHIDQELRGVPDNRIRREVERAGFDGLLRVAANNTYSVAKFKEEFLGKLDWGQARKAIQSQALATLGGVIAELKAEGSTVLTVGEIKARYELRAGQPIYAYHLKFLLQGMTDAGQLEYYSDIGDKVVIDDPEFNRLRTNIPILAADQGGLVDWRQVVETHEDQALYVAMLDKYYTLTGIALEIRKGGWRLFPAFLEERPLRLPPEVGSHLQGTGGLATRTFGSRETRISTLLESLFDLDLDVIDVTATEGLFSWGANAYLYYRLEVSHGALEGPRLKIRFRTGGPSNSVALRLASEFDRLVPLIYGTPLAVGG